jgi:ElaB/YqjD/DUF883 family membrane-anchored ribosome-binding protein
VLFKLVQIGLSVKRVRNIQKKLDKENNNATELQNQLDDEEAVLRELDVAKEMEQEAARMRSQEIEVLSRKRDRLARRIDDLSNKDIFANYKQ